MATSNKNSGNRHRLQKATDKIGATQVAEILADVYDFRLLDEYVDMYKQAVKDKDKKTQIELLRLMAPFLLEKPKPTDNSGLNDHVTFKIQTGQGRGVEKEKKVEPFLKVTKQ